MLEQGQDQSAGIRRSSCGRHQSISPADGRQTDNLFVFCRLLSDEVRRDLIEEYNLNENTVEDPINSGIYIYSTLDVEMQQIAKPSSARDLTIRAYGVCEPTATEI